MANSDNRIGIIGGGAIGGFYGMMLARAGFDVHFLLRSEYPTVAAKGFLMHSNVYGNVRLDNVQAYADVRDMPPCDWLLLGTKATGNADIAPVIARAAAPAAKVLVLQNGLDVEAQLRPLLPASLHLLGCLCYVAVMRKAPGVIEHVALGDVHLGYHPGPADGGTTPQSILEAGAALFQAAGIKAKAVPDLTQARWHKLVYNVAYNGLTVLLDAGTHALKNNAHSQSLVRDIMLEVVAGATRSGYPLRVEIADEIIALAENMPDYLPSMYLDYREHRPMELSAIYEAPLAAVKAAGFSMPKVEALHQALRFIDAHNTRDAHDTHQARTTAHAPGALAAGMRADARAAAGHDL
jgi:2-dehydropantoate 2-reductase